MKTPLSILVLATTLGAFAQQPEPVPFPERPMPSTMPLMPSRPARSLPPPAFLPPAARPSGYDTNLPAVAVEGYSEVGDLGPSNRVVHVSASGAFDVRQQRKRYFLSFIMREQGGIAHGEVDDYEIEPLLKALQYLSQPDVQITKLDHYRATYTTERGMLFQRSNQSPRPMSVNLGGGAVIELNDFDAVVELLKKGKAKIDALKK